MNYLVLRIVTDVIKINGLHSPHLNSNLLNQTSSQAHGLLRQLEPQTIRHGLSKFGGIVCATEYIVQRQRLSLVVHNYRVTNTDHESST
jgi:hypothetical protein